MVFLRFYLAARFAFLSYALTACLPPKKNSPSLASLLILVPTPSTFFVRLARFIFSSEPELELLELLPEELLPEEDEPLLLDEPELELEALRFLAGARFLVGAFLASFFFLSSDELVPDEELLLDEDFFRFVDFTAGFLTGAGFLFFLSDLLLDEELLDFLRGTAAVAVFALLDAGFDCFFYEEEEDED